MNIPFRANPTPGPGFRFGNLDPQTTRQLLHIAYARMWRLNMMSRGVPRRKAHVKAVGLLKALDASQKSIVEFSSTAAERRKRNPACVYCSADGSDTDHLIPRLRGGPEDADNHVPACCVFRRKWNTDFGRSGTRISEEVEQRFREVEHGFRDVEQPFRGKWNAGSGVVNARR